MSETRTDSARRHDDSEIIDAAIRAPSGSDASGGQVARDVGSRDEEKRATDPDAGLTRPEGRDEVQPPTGTRSDHDGANAG